MADALTGAASGATAGTAIAPGIGTVIGGLVGAFSALSSGRKQRERQEAIAEQKRLQALEVARRTASELDILEDNVNEVTGETSAAFAANNIDLSSGNSTQARMKSFENFGRVVLNKTLESKFRQNQLAFEAKFAIEQGKDLQRASVVNAAGTLLSTANKAGAFKAKGGG